MGMELRIQAATLLDSRALPDAADFDLYLIVCKQRAEYPTLCMEYGWIPWLDKHTQKKRERPYTHTLYIYVCVVTYAGDLFDFWHEVDRLLRIELIECISCGRNSFAYGVDDDDDANRSNRSNRP